ncbi:hypothetical protein [Oceanicoccus sagamiensis]|uniref:LPXTG cell wall anchor domain-containing protein n=1 Tax=Oceanicoccus sagamiensis TaxID=716816 RepID=A0A1X9NH35_9GAMM|nr:hypothetical protein [Oceanicoccus sagamiensis]ARN75155.1 hypothetical protein BST96_14145 [Oceanicoccus sagamiensis]
MTQFKKTFGITLMLLSGFLFHSAAMAAAHNMEEVAGLSCEDIDFAPEMIEKYPDITKSCLDVVESKGTKYALVELELTRVSGRNVNFKFVHEDGSKSERYSIRVKPEFRAKIQGKSYRINELSKGQNLNIYLPGDRWEIHQIEEEESYAIETLAMPATASELPLIGIMGGLFVSVAGALAYRRRRQ